MDFFLDENFTHYIPEALNALEKYKGENRVFAVEKVWRKGIPDLELFPKIKAKNGIYLTQDVKNLTRKREIGLLIQLGIPSFIISFGSGCPFDVKAKKMINWWDKITTWSYKNKRPFICRVKANGTLEEYFKN